MLAISETAREKVNRAVVITGSGRSGTTIIGQIIHSLQAVEYVFEPPVLYTLFSLIDKMPEEQWKLLYETYLYEEHFINAIAGRGINCNQQDDSSIYRVKDAADIERRLNRSVRKMEAQEISKHGVIAYKIPDIASRVPKLQDYYPGTQVIIVHRSAMAMMNSLMNKSWFTNENADKNLVWPFTMYKNIQVPFWVKDEDHEKWFQMSTLDRCGYYYLEVTQNISQIKNRIEIDYDDLVASPIKTIEEVAGRLNLSFGPKTLEILASVRPMNSKKDPAILDQMDSELRAKILAL